MIDEDTVQVVALEDLGDEVGGLGLHNENAPPRYAVMKNVRPLDGVSNTSRPMTAGNAALSELEEITLGGTGSIPAPAAAVVVQRQIVDATDPPWSPSSSSNLGARIPSLDEESEPGRGIPTLPVSSPPATPARLASVGDLEGPPSYSPTESERARAEKGGCLVM